MKNLTTILTAILCLTLLGTIGAAAADAASATCQAIEAAPRKTVNDNLIALVNLYQAGCLGGEDDPGAQAQRVTSSVKAITAQAGKGASEYLPQLINELERIKDEIRRDCTTDRTDATLPMLIQPLDDGIAMFYQGAKYTEGPQKPDFWQYQTDTGNLMGLDIEVVKKIQGSCADPATQTCKDEYERSKRAVRYAMLIERIETVMTRAMLDKASTYVNTLDKAWNHYFNDARSQFWWELGINSAIYESKTRGTAGLQRPPDYQLILLHPSLAFEYVDTVRGERYKEALVVEVIGYNAWKWSAGGDMERPLGMSLIATYSDRAGAEPWGYGALFHFNNNLSLGITRHEKETGFMISLDLARLFMQTGDKDKKKMRFGNAAESGSGI